MDFSPEKRETSPETGSQRIEKHIAAIEKRIESIRMKLAGLEAGDKYVIHSLGMTKDEKPSLFLPLDEAALVEALEISNRMLKRFKKKRAEYS
ncbi:MAG: hypothetical protein R3B71_06150 [Candidatus Gracilibacteria bacterium]|nr:hypothetical protein [Candidatus Peregrinibacteria bacterium]